jgi:hypothetical protein
MGGWKGKLLLMRMLLRESKLRLLNICNRPVTRGSELSRSGPWLVWRRVKVPCNASKTALVCRFIAHKPCYNVLGNTSPRFWGVGGGHLLVGLRSPRHPGLWNWVFPGCWGWGLWRALFIGGGWVHCCITQCNGSWGKWYHCPVVEGRVGACCLAPQGHLGYLAQWQGPWGVEECFGSPIVQGQGLTLVHGQLPGNKFVKYPRQGLCVVIDALLGAMCGRPIAWGSLWFSWWQGYSWCNVCLVPNFKVGPCQHQLVPAPGLHWLHQGL